MNDEFDMFDFGRPIPEWISRGAGRDRAEDYSKGRLSVSHFGSRRGSVSI